MKLRYLKAKGSSRILRYIRSCWLIVSPHTWTSDMYWKPCWIRR